MENYDLHGFASMIYELFFYCLYSIDRKGHCCHFLICNINSKLNWVFAFKLIMAD